MDDAGVIGSTARAVQLERDNNVGGMRRNLPSEGVCVGSIVCAGSCHHSGTLALGVLTGGCPRLS